MRLFGTKAGLGTMGILGGLTSSTATTLAFSRQSRELPALSTGFAMAVILACTVMLGRVAILAATVSMRVFTLLWPALIAMCVPGLLYALWILLQKKSVKNTASAPRFTNPLSLKIALQFALLYALVVFLTRAGEAWFGDAGITVVSFISGLTDMDAIALSLSQMTESSKIAPDIAARGIVVGALSNTLLKSGFALCFGSALLRPPVILVFGATILCGIAAWWYI